MPKVNQGYQIDRDRSINTGPLSTYAVDSVGWGTNDVDDGAGPSYPIRKLGGGTANNAAGQSSTNSYWKAGVDVVKTTGGDNTANPFWQLEATWGPTEISVNSNDTITLFEVGTSAGSLTGTNPSGNVDSELSGLYTRKKVGGNSGLGKTQDFSIVARVKLTF